MTSGGVNERQLRFLPSVWDKLINSDINHKPHERHELNIMFGLVRVVSEVRG
jgi:hypothetical protein